MNYATYKLTGEYLTPAEVSINGFTTPVWHQQKWETGEYAIYVQKNGCGHCCTAMAARLHGVDIDPYREFELCRKLWGAPDENGTPSKINYISVCGITKILAHLGIKASFYGVPKGTAAKAARHIVESLEEGKMVIICSVPNEEYPDNPFSKGAHYVLAVGFTEDGKILIANSSVTPAPTGIQLVDEEMIMKAVYRDADPDTDGTWGELPNVYRSAGYVVVE